MRSQIFVVFLVGLVATHALPVPEETVSVMSNPSADVEANENLETKSIAQDDPADLEPKADIAAPENLEPKADIEAPESLEPKADIAAPENLEPKADIEAPESLEPKAIEQAHKGSVSVDNSLEPIAEQMRSVIGSANDAVNDLAAEVKGAAVRALDYAKELTAPLNGVERANVASSLAERALDVYGKMQEDAKNLLDRTLQNTESLQLSGRSILPSAGDFVKILQDKYLTRDGQDLIKTLLSFGNI